MKKSSLLLFVTLFLVGNLGFTKEPEIVNPPRPTKKFRYLLEIKINYDNKTLFVYTDAFHTKYYQSDYDNHYVSELILDSPSQLCYYRENKIFHDSHCSNLDIGPGFLLKDEEMPFVDADLFLISRAPKPRKMTTEEKLWLKFDIANKMVPQEARVVFK